MNKQYFDARKIFFVVFIYLSLFFSYWLSSSDFTSILQLGVSNLIWLSVLTYATVIISAFVFSVLILILGGKIGFMENIHLAVVSQFMNYFGPAKAGAIARGYYVKQVYNVSYANYLSVITVNGLLSITTMGLILLMVLSMGTESYELDALFNTIAVFAVVSAFIPIVISKVSGTVTIYRFPKLDHFIRDFMSGVDLLFIRKKLLLIDIALIASQFIIASYIYYFLLHSLEYDVSIGVAIIICGMASFSSLFALTPGNLGVQELIIIWMTDVFGYGVEVGIQVALVLRLIHMLVVSLHAPVSFISIKRRMDF